MKAIPYGRQHITQLDIDAVVETLQSDFLTQGPKIAEFENNFAKYIGCKYAVAVANGTAALHLCAMAMNVQKGDKVITTPITFAASANCIEYCGGEAVFADINSNTYLLDINKVRALLEAAPKGTYKGIIPVDFAGAAINLEELKKLADEFELWIIEDACHAPGGFFIDNKGTKQLCGNGQFADVAIFSFHPVKHIATGEGGMITTNSKEIYDKLCLLRTHGITKTPELLQENHGGWYYEMQALGYNYRMCDMQAALGITQLQRADDGLQKRKQIAKIYDEAFASNKNIEIPIYNNGHAFHLYIIKVKDRLGLYNYLRAKNIFAQVHYIPVHTMPYYQHKGYKKGDYPIAEKYYEACLSIPMYPTLTNEEQQYVITCINEFV
ncbi:MAG: UDP-4-amino-4,6-dideoxy-N-acetyl-beta-L-altrosamine transaminase [Chitinophagaceae bacterium]|nr:UDP-4-amino-4,6-dideoxy-N-acetyl-beta-L-altrosamine transaminase [Chitinophagaceae bacterium]MCW5905661.1 UDP-4-amino-4,6-dideoxy-N-acetyl-beta-L-altrosamine transaminase [Chitinophagaceae bacterium]